MKSKARIAKQLESEEASPIAVEIRSDTFSRFSSAVSAWVGSRTAVLSAIALIVIWGITGPIFHYSDTWQLVINTGTTIITFLMVFLIQNTQNRDARAINLKLDELIHSIDAAGNQMMEIEKLSDAELDALQARYEEIRANWLKRKSGAT